MSLDSCFKRLAGLLCQGGISTQRTLTKVVEKSGLARSMMMAHLKHMKVDGLVEKEELVQRRVGRLKVIYKPSPKLLEMSKT